MANLTFRDYSAGFILIVFSIAMMVNFSGSVFKTYDTNTSSESLTELKQDAEAAQPSPGTYSNKTQEIDVEENSFLSPSGFGIIQDLFGSVTQLGTFASSVVSELGLPTEILGLMIGIPTIALIFQGVSLLFGKDA
jgi:hypothetical protein